MHKKIVVSGLVALLLASGASAFAQKKQLAKIIRKSNRFERISVPYTSRLAPAMSRVFIPMGTTLAQLEREIQRAAVASGMDVNAHMLASNAELLHQFEHDAGRYVFGSPSLPYEEGLNVLRENQALFAEARSNGEYESAWAEFQAEKYAKLNWYRQHPGAWRKEFYTHPQGFDGKQEQLRRLEISEKIYSDTENIILDVYQFHIQKLHTKNAPQVRLVSDNNQLATVYEIPVNDLRLYVRAIPFEDIDVDIKEISAEEFVVLVNSRGIPSLVSRATLESAENAEGVVYEVVEPVNYEVAD